MPRTPSQKSIDVCRSAPTSVMWWTPWLWSFRISDLSRPESRRHARDWLMPPLEVSPDEFRAAAERVTEASANFLERLDDLPTVSRTSGAATASAFEVPLPEEGLGLTAVDD